MKAGELYEHQFEVTNDVYQGFIKTFNDKNPMHTDSSFAKSYGFRDKVMFGNILNGYLSYFVGECLPLKNVVIHSQEIKFSKPVYLMDQIKLKVVTEEFYESVQTAVFKFSFTNQNQVKVANGKIQVGVLK